MTQCSYLANFSLNSLSIFISKWEPLRAGGSYIPTPQLIQNRGGVVSIRNQDEQCFRYVLEANEMYLKHKEENGKKPFINSERVAKYKGVDLRAKYGFENDEPMKIARIYQLSRGEQV